MINSWLICVWAVSGDWQGQGQGWEEKARVGSCFRKVPTINFYAFSLVKEWNLNRLMEISIFIPASLHIHNDVHVADGGHLRRHAGAGPQEASLEQVHSTVEMVVMIYHFLWWWPALCQWQLNWIWIAIFDWVFPDSLKEKTTRMKMRTMTSVRLCTGGKEDPEWFFGACSKAFQKLCLWQDCDGRNEMMIMVISMVLFMVMVIHGQESDEAKPWRSWGSRKLSEKLEQG